MDFKWKVKYEIIPSLQRSETLEKISFEVISGKTFVQKQHITSNYDDISGTLCKKDSSFIRDILLRRMLYQKIYTPIEIKLIDPPELINREELEQQNAKLTRTVQNSLTMRWGILDVGDSIQESETFWNSGFSDRTNGYDQELLRIASWLEKSETESEHIQQFILTWVAFNSLYGLYSNEISTQSCRGEIQEFTVTISDLLSEAEASKLVKQYGKTLQLLTRLNLTLRNGTNCSSNLAAELQNAGNNNGLNVITKVLECVYCIRNRCFHDGPQATNLPDYVKEVRDFLMPIVSCCVKQFVNFQ